MNATDKTEHTDVAMEFQYMFWEFGSRVYLGEKEGYAESICLREANLPRPVAELHRCTDEGWWFVLQGGSTVLVPHANVRFVYGQSVAKPVASNSAAPLEGDKEDKGVRHEESGEHSGDSSKTSAFSKAYAKIYDETGISEEDIQKVAKWADENGEKLKEITDQNGFPVSKAQAAYAGEAKASPTPKRRGRPPKVRPENT